MPEVKIIITSDGTQAENGMKAFGSAIDKARSSAMDLAKSFAQIYVGVGIVSKLGEAFAAVVPETQKLAGETLKLQRITGLTAESASTLIAVADDVKVKFETLQTAVIAVSRRLGGLKDVESSVIDASGQMVDVFEKFGIKVKTQDGSLRSFMDVFEQIKTKVREASSETERMAIATQFFRGNAAELMPLLTMSKTQWAELAAEAKKWGLVLTAENVAAVRQYTLAHRDMNDALQGLQLALGKAVIPALAEMAERLAESVKGLKDFADANKGIISLPFDTLKYAKSNVAEFVTPAAIALVVAYRDRLAEIITRVGQMTATLSISQAAVDAFGLAIAYSLGQEAGKAIDFLAWRLGGIDLTGMNRITEEIASGQTTLKKGVESVDQAVAKLGLDGIKTWKDFEAAEKAGLIRYDRITGSWRSMREEQAAAKTEIQATVKALSEMSSVVSTMGKSTAIFAEEQFGKALETPLRAINDAIRDHRSDLEKLHDAYRVYESTIQSVFRTQIAMQTKIKEGMLAAKGSVWDVAKQITVLKETELASVKAQLAAQTAFYDQLKARQKEAYETMTKIREEYETNRKEGANALSEVAKLAAPKRSELDQYYADRAALEERTSAAMALSGEKQRAELKAIREAWKSTVREVKEESMAGGSSQGMPWMTIFDKPAEAAKGPEKVVTVLKSVQETGSYAAKQIAYLTDLIGSNLSVAGVDAGNAFQEATNSVRNVEQAIAATKDQVVALDALLQQQRILSIDTSPALANIQTVINALASLGATASTGATESTGGYFPSWEYVPGSGGGSDFNPPLASGTRYVPRNGLYPLHAGERVLNRNETANYDQRRYHQITFAPQVTVYADRETPEDTARRTVKAMKLQLDRLNSLK